MIIYKTNIFEAGDEFVIYLEVLRINYLYLFNVYYCWNKSIEREIMHVIKDIAVDEEILIIYV